jgi:tetratricopeptide (TPR) repeat protein
MGNRRKLLIEALKGRGSVYRLIGESERTIDDLKRIIELYTLEKKLRRKELAFTTLTLAEAYNSEMSDFKTAEKLVKDAMGIINKKEYPDIFTKACFTRAKILLCRTHYDEALKVLLKILPDYKKMDDRKELSEILNCIGWTFTSKGELDKALRFLKRSLTIAEKINNRHETSLVIHNIGLVYKTMGDLSTALKFYKKHLRLSEEIGYKKGVGITMGNIGSIYSDRGEFEKALKYLKGSLEIAEEIDDRLGVCVVSNNLGNVHANTGRLDLAEKCFRDYLEMSEKIHYEKGIGTASYNLGNIHTETGKYSTAKRFYSRAEKIFTRTGAKLKLSEVYINLSDLHCRIKDHEKAISFAEKAYVFAKKSNAEMHILLSLHAWGKGLMDQYPKKALLKLKEAERRAEKESMKHELSKIMYELSVVFKKLGRYREATRYLKKAEKIFKA